MEQDVFIIDRIEENFAICENFFTGEQKEINKKEICSGVKEGDVLVKEDGKYKLDLEKTIKRKIEMKMKFDSIW